MCTCKVTVFDFAAKPYVLEARADTWSRRLRWLAARMRELATVEPDSMRRCEQVAVIESSSMSLDEFRESVIERTEALTDERARQHRRMLYEVLRVLDPLVFVVARDDEPPLYVHRRVGARLRRIDDKCEWLAWKWTIALMRCASQPDHACAHCHRLGADATCTACSITFYCSRECQSAHWRVEHRHFCPTVRTVALEPDNEYSALIV